MKKLGKKHRQGIVILTCCLLLLLIGFQNCGKKGSETFPSGSTLPDGSTTTLPPSSTTTTTNSNTTLEVTEIESSSTPQQSWTWNCTQSFRPCQFRYDFNTAASHEFTVKDYIPNNTTATKTDVQGNYYLHIQAKSGDVESQVKSVQVVIGPPDTEGGKNPFLVDQIDTSGSHTCSLNFKASSNPPLEAGYVKCWGLNDKGQLGYGDKKNRGDGKAASITISQLPDVDVDPTDDQHLTEFIATGGQHTCALLKNKCIKCWGSNEFGQLGYADKSNDIGDANSEMGGNLGPVGGAAFKVKTIATGSAHTCSITEPTTEQKAKAHCWGQNDQGQLGQGDTTDRTEPNNITPIDIHPVDPTKTAAENDEFLPKHIAAGAKHTCVVLENDCVKCWGGNQHGQLGYGDTDNRGDDSTANNGAGDMGGNLPPVGGDTFKVKTLVTGDWHNCAIMNDDSVQCWGWNDKGQLGVDASTTPHIGNAKNAQDKVDFIPVDLGGKTAKSITAGAKHTCVTLNDDSTKCWGLNQSGQLGQGNTNDIDDPKSLQAIPIETSGAIAGKPVAGGDTTCFALDDRKVKCWGNNDHGQLAKEHICSLGNGSGYSASSTGTGSECSTPSASDVMGKTVDTIDYLSFE